MSLEIKIRVRPIIKDKLVELKEKTGLSVNFQVNFAIFKYLILDTKVPYWVLDARPNPNYDVINKLPEELKFCDGDSCELPIGEKTDAKERKGEHTVPEIRRHPEVNELDQSDSKPRGDKC